MVWEHYSEVKSEKNVLGMFVNYQFIRKPSRYALSIESRHGQVACEHWGKRWLNLAMRVRGLKLYRVILTLTDSCRSVSMLFSVQPAADHRSLGDKQNPESVWVLVPEWSLPLILEAQSCSVQCASPPSPWNLQATTTSCKANKRSLFNPNKLCRKCGHVLKTLAFEVAYRCLLRVETP